LLNTHTKISMSEHKTDITCWEEISLATLNARQKRRFQKHKVAITAYFTTDVTPDEIAQQHDISALSLLSMAEKCLMRHADGYAWGFRALLPGVNVVNYALPAEQETLSVQDTSTKHDEPYDEDDETTAKRPVIVRAEPAKLPTIPINLPETPHPVFDDDEFVDANEVMTGFTPVMTSTDVLPLVTETFIPIPTVLSFPILMEEVSVGTASTVEEDVTQIATVPISIPTALSFPIPFSTVEEDVTQTATVPISIPTALSFPIPFSTVEEAIAQIATVPVPIPTVLSFIFPVSVDEASVGTDLSRPSRQSIGQEDVINRSLQASDIPSSAYVRRPGSGKTGPHKIVRKRRIQDTLVQTRQRRGLYHILSLALVALVLLGVLVPLGTGLAAYSVYNNVRGVALDGVNHLLNVKNLLTVSKSDPTAALDAKKLHQSQTEFKLAQADFLQLQDFTNRSDILALLEEFSPDYANKFLMTRRLVRVALDVSKMGQEVSGVAIMGAGLIHSSPLANGVTKPLVSVGDIASIDGAIIHALYYIDDIRVQMSQVRMSDVPISDKQKAQLLSLLVQLPKIEDMLTQGQGLVGLVSWLLGVGHERRFLVQTLDRAELRPSGGFTGQYGVLQIKDGRMAPFSLRDVALLDYAGNGVELGRSAPPAYSSWMNFGNWGLRDSNLSGDYPTTARMSMQVFQDEGGGPVDGDISFTPTFIGHILDVTGPIRVAEYNETITSKNLEERLHYYQQDYSAIAIEHQKSNDNSHAARKAFTSLVGKMLLDRVRHLSTKQLLDVVKGAIKDIQSHDLEIYFADPQAEQWLSDHGYSGATDSFAKQDGFEVVQANISISKASQYVHTTEHDDIVLDAQGGATHNLTITLDYQQTGQVYGFDTYADYIRVYVPQNAQFLSGDGFDTGQALCNPTPVGPPKKGVPPPPGTGGTTQVTGCSQYDTYFPSDARTCPDGNYKLGDRGYQQAWTIDSLGTPTNLSSDLPGHAMWGGLTATPKNCTSTISLSWYVPHAAKNITGQSPYALVVQKQGGYIPSIELTIDAKALAIKGPFAFKGNLSADKTFAFPARK